MKMYFLVLSDFDEEIIENEDRDVLRDTRTSYFQRKIIIPEEGQNTRRKREVVEQGVINQELPQREMTKREMIKREIVKREMKKREIMKTNVLKREMMKSEPVKREVAISAEPFTQEPRNVSKTPKSPEMESENEFNFAGFAR